MGGQKRICMNVAKQKGKEGVLTQNGSWIYYTKETLTIVKGMLWNIDQWTQD